MVFMNQRLQIEFEMIVGIVFPKQW